MPAAIDTLPAKSKLKKNYLYWGLGVLVVVIFGIAFGTSGSDLGQGESIQKAAAAAEAKKAADYKDKIVNPTGAAATTFEALANKPGAISPGAPLPNASSLPKGGVSDDEFTRYEAVRGAIATSRKSSETRTPTINQNTTVSPMRNGDDVTINSGAASRSSFASYSRGTQKTNSSFGGPTNNGVLVTDETRKREGLPSDPNYDAKIKDANALLDAARERERIAGAAATNTGIPRPAPTAPTATGDANTDWLVRAQSASSKPVSNILPQPNNGRDVIFAGSIIKAALNQAIDTKLPGVIVARVLEDVYGSRYQDRPLIPRGATLLGSYRSNVQDGQARVLMAFDRVILPKTGATIALGNMGASDALGIAGVEGTLHTHFWKRMGIATLLAYETFALEKKLGPVGSVQGSSGNGQNTASGAAQIMVQTGNLELQRQYAVTPNITMPPGKIVTIILTDNIEVPVGATAR